MSNIRINDNTKSNIKISLDRTGVLNLQNRAKESSSLLNDYITRRNNNEWMSEDEIKNYRSAFERYKSSTSALADLQRSFGNYNEEDGKERDEWLSTLSTDFDSASKIYNKFGSEDDYKASLRKTEQREKMRVANLEDIAVEIADLKKQLEEEKSKMPPWAKYTGWATAEILERKLKEKQNYYDSAKMVQEYEKYSADELYKLANEATNNDDEIYFRGLANQKIVQGKSEILATNKMDGEDMTVLEAVHDLDRIEDRDERKARKKVISDKMTSLGVDFNEYYTRITGDDNITLGGVMDWLGKTVASGLDSWNKAITSTADLVLGKPMQALGWENNPISSIAQYYDESYDNRVFNRNLAASKISDSKWIDYAGQFGEGLIAAVPDALLAFMTAGASKIKDLPAYMAKAPAYAQGSNLARTQKFAMASAYASGDKLTKAGLTVQSMMKNPNYWSSFARTYGLDYAEAKEMGASDEVAVFGATISSLINAGIEIGIDGGSGIQGFAQDLADGNKNKFFAWIESSLEEGGEEILQGFVNNLVSKTMYDSTTELANLEQMIAEGAMGTAIGAVLGGGQTITSSAVNKAKQTAAVNDAYRRHGQTIVKEGGVDTLQALANEVAGVVGGKQGQVITKLDSKVNGKKGVNAKAVGKLSYAVNDARIQQNKADIVKALEEKGVSKNKAAKYTDILFEMNEEFFVGEESAFTLGTDEQWKKITGDENAYSVLRNIITDEKSPVNIRNLRYGLSRNGIRVDGDGKVNQEDVENYRTRQLVRAADEGLITPVKNKFDVSENGKTQITKSGETVKKRTFLDGTDGTLRLQVNDNSIVDVEDVSFADEGEAIVYSMIVNMGMDAETANAVISLYKGKDKKAGSRFAYGINLAFNAGKINHSPNILREIHSLTAQQADAVYKLGRQYAQKSAQKAQERVDAKKKKTTSTKRGEVIYEGDLADENGNLAVKESELTGMQQASLSGIRLLAEISNIRFHIYRSEKMISKDGGEEFRYVAPNGESVTANGFYITGTNDIYIDLNAGNNGEGTMMYTAAHEIMHFIKEFSPAKFQQIADFLMEEYAKRPNVNVEMLLHEQIASVKKRSDAERLSEQEIHDMAFEEMVCDAMSGMLIDGSFADSMAKLHETNKGLWQTIADAVAKLLEKWGVVVDAYKGARLDSQEALAVARMDGAFRKLQQMFAEGMTDAGNAYAQMEKTGSEKFSRRNGFKADDVIKYSDRSNVKNLVKSKRSRYNEFATLAMQWANKTTRQSGDNTIIYDGRRKKYVLIEAMEEGYFEVAAGTYEEMRSLYERVHREEDRGIHADINTARSGSRSGLWDLQLSQNRGYDARDAGPLGSQGLQNDSAGSDEHLRGGDQGKLVKTSQRTSGKVKYQERSTALLDREGTRTDYAPVFYSKLERVVDGIKDDKIGANGVVSYLKGKGVKDEEIKWSGIQLWLDGKKSVTKKELQQFVADNMLVVDEEILIDNPNVDEEKQTRHSDSVLVGGTNYREMLFRLPQSSYSNDKMRGHWGRDAEGILMHARIQDFVGADARKVLFIEEIQSDWHNEARKTGYAKPPSPRLAEYLAKMEAIDERYDALVEEDKKTKENDPRKQQINDEIFALEDEMEALGDEYEDVNTESRLREAAPPSDLFRKTYHEYILKRLIRMAAEEGYDSIAWTPAKVQMARWDEDFKEAFRILYDQQIPSFLKKYGKQWGATVNKTPINAKIEVEYDEEIIEESLYDELTSGTIDVWRMDLTDSMRESALYAGQMMFQERSRESTEESSENKYSYEELIRKPDMLITMVGGNVPTNRADVVALAKKNAAKVGKTNKDGSVSVHVNDIDTDVVLGTNGLKHGLDRRLDVIAPVTLQAGSILQNSIKINELIPQREEADDSYVLIGAAKNAMGQLYVVRSVINRFSSELVSMDVLYALNAKTEFEGKKERAGRETIPKVHDQKIASLPAQQELATLKRPGFQGPVTSSTISIADLLDYVNEYFPDILPEDVLRHYGYTERPSGDLGGAVLYQQRTSDPTQEKVVQQLEKENAQLVADLAAVKELLALQGKVTGGKMFSKTSLQAVAKRLANKVNANADVTELVELLNDAYRYILTEHEASWDGFAEKARPVTAWLMRHAQEKKTRTDEAQAALKYIRSKSVYLDEAQKQEVEYIFGSYNDFRKKAMGRITVIDSARVSLDSQWQEFAEMFPSYFDQDVNSADQPVALMEAIDALQNTYDYFGSDMMNEQSLLMDVYDGYWDIATLRTVADKAQKEINLLKAKHRRQMADIRDKHKQADVQLRRECQAAAEVRGNREGYSAREGVKDGEGIGRGGAESNRANDARKINTSQRTDGRAMYQERSTALLEREETRTDYAPVFYSKLERLVDDMKAQKLGTDSIIGYLKGRGIKDEEIKHLGIRELFKGKKSVTKLELKNAIAKNMPRIEEVILTDDPNISKQNRARHSDAALLGGANYRDVLFLLPYEENYLNLTMSGHWDTRYTNVLAHTRIQDFTDMYGKRLLFIEEIQSDWHNAHKHNVDYGLPPSKKLMGIMHRIGEFNEKRRNLEGRLENLSDTDPRSRVILDELEKVERDFWKYKMQNDVYKELENASPPSDLFSDTYHEYILKRLIRMAAEEGYDSLAWTPAKVQVARWDKDFEGAFHILYDQNIPGFLKKYGKQWGATVGKTTINAEIEVDNDEDIIEESLYEELTSGTIDVWCMDITDSMRESALYEGQMMFQERDKSAASSPVYDEQAYRDIIRKSDMPIIDVGGFVPKNRADTVVYAKRKAAKIGRFNKDGRVSVYVGDLDEEVLLGTDGLKHGLHRMKDTRKDASYIVTLHAGEIIRSAVRIDEIFADDARDDQYVLLGVAANDKEQLHIVRFIVNRPENELASIEVLATEDRAVFELLGASDNRSTIPVANLLEYVVIGETAEEQESNENYKTISNLINARNTAKGKPSAISLYDDVELNNRQKALLQKLDKYDASIIVGKSDVSMVDLSALTAKTGDEFAMFTKDNERMVVRGNSFSVNIDIDKARDLAYNGFRWSGHTHPGFDYNCMLASDNDYLILEAFGQNRSVTYNSLGQYLTFELEGVK